MGHTTNRCVGINEYVYIVNQIGGGFNCDNINIFVASCLCMCIWWIQGLYNWWHLNTHTHTVTDMSQWFNWYARTAPPQCPYINYMYTSIHKLHVHVYTCVRVSVCVCVCIYMYMYSIDQTCFTGLYHKRPSITHSRQGTRNCNKMS